MSQPLESSQHDTIQSKKGLPDRHVHNKNSHSFLSWKQKSQYYIPILEIVCVHFTSNADTINIWFTVSVKRRLETPDCRPGIKYRLRVKCRLQTADQG